jgi:hypothetical protein
MAYLQVELDSLRRADAVAGLLGLSAQHLLGGLVKLWAFAFAEKRSTVSLAQLAGFFACKDPHLSSVLVDFDFLEVNGEGVRIKGTDRYDRLAESRLAGGKTRAKSASRAGGKFTSWPPAGAGSQLVKSPADHQLATSWPPAATSSLIRDPRSEIRDPKKESTPLSANADVGNPVDIFVEIWNREALPEFARVTKCEPGSRRWKAAGRALREAGGLEVVSKAIANLNAWAYRGDPPGSWKPSFDYLTRDSNLLQFAEGAKGGLPKRMFDPNGKSPLQQLGLPTDRGPVGVRKFEL